MMVKMLNSLLFLLSVGDIVQWKTLLVFQAHISVSSCLVSEIKRSIISSIFKFSAGGATVHCPWKGLLFSFSLMILTSYPCVN